MRATLKRRLALLGVLLIAVALATAAITILGAEKAIQGRNKESIGIIKSQQTAQMSTQRAMLQAKHAARLKSILSIALKDGRVQVLIAGKNYTVVGTAVQESRPDQSMSHVRTALLVLKVDNKFYAVVMDVPHQRVTAVEERSCYGPLCNS